MFTWQQYKTAFCNAFEVYCITTLINTFLLWEITLVFRRLFVGCFCPVGLRWLTSRFPKISVFLFVVLDHCTSWEGKSKSRYSMSSFSSTTSGTLLQFPRDNVYKHLRMWDLLPAPSNSTAIVHLTAVGDNLYVIFQCRIKVCCHWFQTSCSFLPSPLS